MPYVTFDDVMRAHFLVVGFVLQFLIPTSHSHRSYSSLTLRRLMSYIYIYMEHPFLMFLNHIQRRSTVGRTPLDE